MITIVSKFVFSQEDKFIKQLYMKHLRSTTRNCAIALLSISSFSCIDNAYDINNLNKEVELFKNSLSAPVGTTTIYLDSIIGGLDVDSTVLNVKNGMYVFGYSGNFDLGNLSSTFNTFKIASIPPTEGKINLYNASGIPESTLPIPLPNAEAKNYLGSLNIPLPTNFGKTELIDIDSISLTNTYVKISAACVGLSGGNGKVLGDNMFITFTADDAADYYIDGVKKKSWVVRANEFKTVEIRKIRLAGGNNKLGLDYNVSIQIENSGDVMITKNIQSYMNYQVEFLDGIDYDIVFGKVNYGLSGSMDPIHFDGLGEIINENDVLSIYNPTITLNTEGNLGVPINLDLNMSTENSKTGKKANLTNASFKMLATSSPSIMKTNTFALNKDNGTSNLFKINPDLIQLSYDIQTDTTTSNHFLAKNTQLNMSYKMEIPLQFGSDLRISIDTTLENPFSDNLDKLEDQENLNVALLLSIKNRIPLDMQIELEALNENGDSLFTVKTDPIDAAVTTGGYATNYTETTTEVTLSNENINKIKDTKMFRVSFIVSARQGETFVTVQPSDYITITIGGKINGGVILDLSSDSK